MHPRPVPGRWPAAAYTCLMVALTVAEPAVVSLTVHDHVQLDRVTGASAERHGDLIPPGHYPGPPRRGNLRLPHHRRRPGPARRGRAGARARGDSGQWQGRPAGAHDGSGPAGRHGRQPARPRAHPDRTAPPRRMPGYVRPDRPRTCRARSVELHVDGFLEQLPGQVQPGLGGVDVLVQVQLPRPKPARAELAALKT